IHLYFILLLLTIITLVVGSSYQPVSFVSRPSSGSGLPTSYSSITVHNKTPVVRKRGSSSSRLSRSYSRVASHGVNNEIAWQNGVYLAASPVHGVNVEIGRGGHLTPDFSNGLDYADPYLVTGLAAQAIAKLLYSHELFFTDYPHVSALLKYQQLRRDNGLEGHRLGSIRRESPFYRYRSQYLYAR
ncbi:hypothetical protein ILUMI_04648, partial [Ignelater luminosus]